MMMYLRPHAEDPPTVTLATWAKGFVEGANDRTL